MIKEYPDLWREKNIRLSRKFNRIFKYHYSTMLFEEECFLYTARYALQMETNLINAETTVKAEKEERRDE